jgi:hypothetical protein
VAVTAIASDDLMMALLSGGSAAESPHGLPANAASRDLKVLLHEGRSAPDCREGLMKFR